MNDAYRTIIFFDDECLLCNKAIQWILRNEVTHTILFAPLKGVHAGIVLEEFINLPDSIIVLVDKKIFIKSTAFIHVMDQMGGRWKFVSVIMKFIPRYLRDFAYDIIATNRYTWFGRTTECLMKSDPYAQRYLD